MKAINTLCLVIIAICMVIVTYSSFGIQEVVKDINDNIYFERTFNKMMGQ